MAAFARLFQVQSPQDNGGTAAKDPFSTSQEAGLSSVLAERSYVSQDSPPAHSRWGITFFTPAVLPSLPTGLLTAHVHYYCWCGTSHV